MHSAYILSRDSVPRLLLATFLGKVSCPQEGYSYVRID